MAAMEEQLPDDHYRITYDEIHLLIAATAKHILGTFSPDVLIAIGGGGFYPARVLRTFLKRKAGNGKLVNVPIQAIGLSLYEDLGQEEKEKESSGPSSMGRIGTTVVRTQWLDAPKREGKDGQLAGGLLGKNILIVVSGSEWTSGMERCLTPAAPVGRGRRLEDYAEVSFECTGVGVALCAESDLLRSDMPTMSCFLMSKTRSLRCRPKSELSRRPLASPSLSSTTSCAQRREVFRLPGPTMQRQRTTSRGTVTQSMCPSYPQARRSSLTAPMKTGQWCLACGTLLPRPRQTAGSSSE